MIHFSEDRSYLSRSGSLRIKLIMVGTIMQDVIDSPVVVILRVVGRVSHGEDEVDGRLSLLDECLRLYGNLEGGPAVGLLYCVGGNQGADIHGASTCLLPLPSSS